MAEGPLTLLGALYVGTSLFFRRFPTVAATTLTIWGPLNALISYQEYFVLDPEDVWGMLRLTMLAERADRNHRSRRCHQRRRGGAARGVPRVAGCDARWLAELAAAFCHTLRQRPSAVGRRGFLCGACNLPWGPLFAVRFNNRRRAPSGHQCDQPEHAPDARPISRLSRPVPGHHFARRFREYGRPRTAGDLSPV